MICLDLDWISKTSVTKPFSDGRLVLRICQACVWPYFCPPVSEKALDFAKSIATLFPQTQTSPVWEQIKQLVSLRYQKRVDLLVPSTQHRTTSIPSQNMYGIAKQVFLKQKNNENLVPLFARREFLNNPVQGRYFLFFFSLTNNLQM